MTSKSGVYLHQEFIFTPRGLDVPTIHGGMFGNIMDEMIERRSGGF